MKEKEEASFPPHLVEREEKGGSAAFIDQVQSNWRLNILIYSVMFQPQQRKKLVLIGDSITQQSFSVEHRGWGAALADYYHRTADVINRGYSGYNSRWIRAIIDKGILSSSDISFIQTVSLVTLFLGANDAVHATADQHVSVAEYKENLIAIIQYIRSINENIVIVIITPPAVNSEHWPTRSNEQVAPYAATVRELAAEYNLGLVDLHSNDDGNKKIELSDLRDGLHLNEYGNSKVFDALRSLIRRRYPALCPDDNSDGKPNIPLHYPHFSELTSKDSEAAILHLASWKWPQ